MIIVRFEIFFVFWFISFIFCYMCFCGYNVDVLFLVLYILGIYINYLREEKKLLGGVGISIGRG